VPGVVERRASPARHLAPGASSRSEVSRPTLGLEALHQIITPRSDAVSGVEFSLGVGFLTERCAAFGYPTSYQLRRPKEGNE
jgi:hypothetical protein